MIFLLPMVAAASGACLAAPSDDGITGYSGNPATRGGQICTACHGGGSSPTVVLSGPPTVQIGKTYLYSLTISGGQQQAGGLDVSATDGTLSVVDAGTKIQAGELTHRFPKSAGPNGDVVFTFDWTAPATAGPVVLYGAGNSVNLNGKNSGDFPDKDSLAINVVDCLVTFQEYGSGTSGSGGFVPTLSGTDGDCNGGWGLDITGGLGRGGGFLWTSGASATLPFACGNILVDITSPLFFSMPVKLGGPVGVAGAGNLSITGVDLTPFAGLSIHLQGLMLDQGACKSVSLTNGLVMEIG